MDRESDDPWLRLTVVATRIGQSRESARKLVAGGVIPGKRHARRGMWQVRESVLNAYLARIETQPETEAAALG